LVFKLLYVRLLIIIKRGKRKMHLIKKIAACSALVMLTSWSAASATQIEILPSSYSIDKDTDCGSYCYHDNTGNQLIDGKYGTAPWSADLGNGHAYEWLGWVRDTPVNIDFDFGTATQIDSINVGTVQDHVNDVVVPDLSVFSSSDGSTWSLIDSILNPESSSNNNQYFTLEFDALNINDQYVRIAAAHNTNGPWTFIDEVDFYQNAKTAKVPEPGSVALLGLGLLGLAARRRRQQ